MEWKKFHSIPLQIGSTLKILISIKLVLPIFPTRLSKRIFISNAFYHLIDQKHIFQSNSPATQDIIFKHCSKLRFHLLRRDLVLESPQPENCEMENNE